MQFRVVQTNYKGTVRQYGQIVESFRRPGDNMPTHRVLFSLGLVNEVEAANFKASFAASRAGKRVHVIDREALSRFAPAVAWTRDLANVAAVLQAFVDSGLHQLIRQLFAGHDEDVDPADVVAALVAQRCVAPDSKLAACRWFPTTVLPDLLGISPAQFHNTRVHRVLSRLEAAETDLQAALASHLLRADGKACTAYFIDCTDTWFAGHGPPMARRGKTKEEFVRYKVGIILLCRQDGMPLRFKVIPGNTDDGVAMLSMLRGMAAEPWLAGAPLVADRALGNTADLLEFIDMDLPFVTALVSNEHTSYGAVIDCPALADVDAANKDCLDKVGDAVVAVGMTRHSADLYWFCRSTVRRGQAERDAVEAALGSRTMAQRHRGDDLVRDMLELALKYEKVVVSGKLPSYSALQRGLGRSNGHMHRHCSLLKLPADIRDRILAGEGKHLTKKAISRICAEANAEKQSLAFAVECANAGDKVTARHQAPRAPNDAGNPWVTTVVVFNPTIWQAKRQRAAERQGKFASVLAALNQRLAKGEITVEHATKTVVERLDKLKLRQFYGKATAGQVGGATVLTVPFKREKWHKTRQRDGFHVVAASPDVDLSPVELVKLYRAKDKVEKDFQEIKSVLELRPVRHRTDAKVRAHVTLCVLALAVQRTMEAKLVKAERTDTAAAALEVLKTQRLVGLRYPSSGDVVAAPSEGTAEQVAIAKALDVSWVLDPVELGKRQKIFVN